MTDEDGAENRRDLSDPARLPQHVRKNLKWFYELHYWKTLITETPAAASNDHFERCYTELFGIDRASYAGQRLLDVGCGPLNSLDWADDAADCVGVDPLADKYAALGEPSKHMRVHACTAEELPFDDASFDTVSSFNSLDHVDDYQKALSEMRRVCRPGGNLLLIVEVNHAPTMTEPHTITPDVADNLPGFSVAKKFVVQPSEQHSIYESVHNGVPQTDPRQQGVLCVHLVRDRAAG
ncbi:MAG: class I SAM-dependent methyltransferase [Pseudomonadota bacterium]